MDFRNPWCPACGGSGICDEVAAERLGIDLGDARTTVCPLCNGSGIEPQLDGCMPIAGFIAGIAAAALGFAIVGGSLYAIRYLLHMRGLL